MSDTTGGYEHDLREAENAMTAAGHPDIALGMRRHSEAQRNMMQGVLVPSFVDAVDRVVKKAIGEKVDPVAFAIGELRTEVATRLGKIERDMRGLDKRHRAQIKALAIDIATIKDVVAARPAQRQAENDRLDARLEDIERRTAALEDNNARLEALEEAIAALRAASVVERDGQ